MGTKRDRVFMSQDDRERYEKLKQEAVGRGRDSKELFLLAVATGLRNQVRRPLETRHEFVRTEYFNDRDMALLHAAAVSETGDLNVIGDRSAVLDVAEEYAHAGIRLLADMIDGSPHEGFEKAFEKELYEAHRATNGAE